LGFVVIGLPVEVWGVLAWIVGMGLVWLGLLGFAHLVRELYLWILELVSKRASRDRQLRRRIAKHLREHGGL
jgi:hypothetical protein